VVGNSGLFAKSFHEKADPCQECFVLSMSSSLFSRPAKPPLSPPFHPHSYVSDVRSVQVGCSRFSRRCYLVSVLDFLLYEGSWARTWSQSPKLGGRAQLFG
jgi:hypothetical protein